MLTNAVFDHFLHFTEMPDTRRAAARPFAAHAMDAGKGMGRELENDSLRYSTGMPETMDRRGFVCLKAIQ